MFSRYWTEIIVIGILPLVALIGLNYGIYLKIRKSARFRKLNDGFVVRFGRRPKPEDMLASTTSKPATIVTTAASNNMRLSASVGNAQQVRF